MTYDIGVKYHVINQVTYPGHPIHQVVTDIQHSLLGTYSTLESTRGGSKSCFTFLFSNIPAISRWGYQERHLGKLYLCGNQSKILRIISRQFHKRQQTPVHPFTKTTNKNSVRKKVSKHFCSFSESQNVLNCVLLTIFTLGLWVPKHKKLPILYKFQVSWTMMYIHINLCTNSKDSVTCYNIGIPDSISKGFCFHLLHQ